MSTIFAILFVFATADHPEPMQALTKQTWESMELCEGDLAQEGIKFALWMQAHGHQFIGQTTAQCVEDPRQVRS